MPAERLLGRPDCCPGRGSIWQHVKSGDIYTVVTVARHSERPNDWIVVYRPMHGDGDDWVRNLIQLDGPAALQWPGFLDTLDRENKIDRFRWVAGPETWGEGRGDISPLFALAKLTAEAIRIEEGRALNDGYVGLESNPNYRRLVRVVRAAMESMFDEDPDEVELPAALFETPKVTDGEIDQVLTQKPMPRVCETCNRDTQAPLFDGCMTPNCPRGHEPCL